MLLSLLPPRNLFQNTIAVRIIDQSPCHFQFSTEMLQPLNTHRSAPRSRRKTFLPTWYENKNVVRRRCQQRKSEAEQQAAALASGVPHPSAGASAAEAEAPPQDAFRFPPIGAARETQLFSVSTTATKERAFVTFRDVKVGDKTRRLISCTHSRCSRWVIVVVRRLRRQDSAA